MIQASSNNVPTSIYEGVCKEQINIKADCITCSTK